MKKTIIFTLMIVSIALVGCGGGGGSSSGGSEEVGAQNPIPAGGNVNIPNNTTN